MNRTQEMISGSPEETTRIGRGLGERLRGGEVILLFGPLGAGKTQLVRGIAAGLGIAEGDVSSPSYALINEYAGRLKLYHVDLYRLRAADLPDLGLEELYGRRVVVAIEWAERLEEAGWDLGTSIIIEIDHQPGHEQGRLIAVDEAAAE